MCQLKIKTHFSIKSFGHIEIGFFHKIVMETFFSSHQSHEQQLNVTIGGILHSKQNTISVKLQNNHKI